MYACCIACCPPVELRWLCRWDRRTDGQMQTVTLCFPLHAAGVSNIQSNLVKGRLVTPQKFPFPYINLDPRVTRGSLDLHEPAPQMASRSVQLLLRSTPVWPAHSHTDNATCDICSNRPHLLTACIMMVNISYQIKFICKHRILQKMQAINKMLNKWEQQVQTNGSSSKTQRQRNCSNMSPSKKKRCKHNHC